MLVYLITFAICLFADKVKNSAFKNLFLCWLSIFLCFGYTVGSDWRQYELDYLLDFNELQKLRSLYILFNFISSLFYDFGVDFWLYTGVFKCLFLYAVIQVVKLFTDKIFFVLGLLMPSVLLFMLIDGPFKFMMAMTLILFGFKALVCSHKFVFWALSISAIFIHFTAGIFVLIIYLIYILKDKMKNANFYILFALLICSTIVSTSLSFFTSLSSSLAMFIPLLEGKTEAYAVDTTTGWLTLGNIVNYVFFFIIYYSKSRILQLPRGEYIYTASMFKVILFGVFLIIPTGFRLNLFNNILFEIACASICVNLYYKPIILKYRPLLLCVIISYSLYTLNNKIWNSYLYLPYTNSIPYILNNTSGRDYFKRSQRGYVDYFERTGREIEKD